MIAPCSTLSALDLWGKVPAEFGLRRIEKDGTASVARRCRDLPWKATLRAGLVEHPIRHWGQERLGLWQSAEARELVQP